MKVDRTRWKKNEFKPPSSRVYRAMARITKHQYLRPEEVKEICWRLSKIASPACWIQVFHRAVGVCRVVGMIGVEPPFRLHEYGYGDVLKLLEKEKDKTKVLIGLLKIKEKQSENNI